MNFGFSDEHDAIRDTLARMLSDHATLAVAHDCLEAADGFDSIPNLIISVLSFLTSGSMIN